MKNRKISLDRIEKWARSNPFLVTLAIVIVILSALVTLIDGGAKLRDLYVTTFGGDKTAYSKLRLLATETQIEYFSSILGAPTFKNRQGKYSEYIFVAPKFYVQAVTDSEGKVLLFSVTTRSASFNPTLDLGAIDPEGTRLTVTLGKTTFSQIRDLPRLIDGYSYSKGLSYREKYYFGNPGYYQNYNFLFCEAGVQVGELQSIGEINIEAQEGISTNSLTPALAKFRRECVINTYCVAAPLLDIDDELEQLGPSYEQVRLLDELAK